MLTKQRSILIVFIFAVWTVHLSGCLNESKQEASSKTTYSFLNNARSAEINTPQPEYVKLGQEEFTINDDRRVILFEHPNSEVVFKDVPVIENVVLQFGIGINQATWDKPGDGVLFEVIIADDKSRQISVFSNYIDPKKNPEDRKWFDYSLDLQAFAGQEVSFVFKTSGGQEGNVEYDWAGWSNPQIVSTRDKGWLRRLWSILS